MAKIKAKEGEKLDDATIELVISLLEGEKPITKKEACERLRISYNTARLTKIIEEYKASVEETAKRRQANRGKPASEYEIQSVIEGYLSGESATEIGKRLYRSTAFVKEVVARIGVPQKLSGEGQQLVPDQCISDTFESGQLAWSVKHNAMVIVLREEDRTKWTDFKLYSVFVLEQIEEESPFFPQYQGFGGQHSCARSYDLASLEHLKQYKIDVYRPYRPHFKNWLAGR